MSMTTGRASMQSGYKESYLVPTEREFWLFIGGDTTGLFSPLVTVASALTHSLPIERYL
jgi:hypothetical protein